MHFVKVSDLVVLRHTYFALLPGVTLVQPTPLKSEVPDIDRTQAMLGRLIQALSNVDTSAGSRHRPYEA